MANYNPNNPENQNNLILAHLRKGGTITALTAYKAPVCCTRLSGRIWDLRNAGNDIKDRWKVVGDRKKMVKEYYMDHEQVHNS